MATAPAWRIHCPIRSSRGLTVAIAIIAVIVLGIAVGTDILVHQLLARTAT